MGYEIGGGGAVEAIEAAAPTNSSEVCNLDKCRVKVVVARLALASYPSPQCAIYRVFYYHAYGPFPAVPG